AQNRSPRPLLDGNAADRRSRIVRTDREGHLRREARITRLELELILLFGADRIVPERCDSARDVRPDRPQPEEILVEDGLPTRPNAKGMRVIERADPLRG